MEKGIPIDSMKPENIDRVQKELSLLRAGESKTITFKDGSKIVYGSELVENDDFQIMQSPGDYRLKVYWYTGALNAKYYLDYKIVSGKNNDYIKSAHSESIIMVGGSYSNVKLTVPRKYETSTRYAYSRLYFDYTYLGVNARFNLYAHVGNNDWHTSLSLKDSK